VSVVDQTSRTAPRKVLRGILTEGATMSNLGPRLLDGEMASFSQASKHVPDARSTKVTVRRARGIDGRGKSDEAQVWNVRLLQSQPMSPKFQRARPRSSDSV